ncbi:MAG: zinc-dependent metalloprotease [Chitinophagaceae bacterium]|nr:zinc-dependent metalloprotease [Chitinophagaceae bacterium]
MHRTFLCLKWMLTVHTVFVCLSSYAQPRVDTTRFPGNGFNGRGSTGPRPYKEVITNKTISDAGLFLVHKVEDKYYFEIPDSLLGREILVVNRISKAAAGMRIGGFFGYAGDNIGQNVIRFEKGPNNKVFLRSLSFAEYTKDSTSPMFTAVNNSNIQPIAASFDVKSPGRDSTGVVIDVTDYIGGDNDVLHFSSGAKSNLRISALQADKSYITSVRSYPINIEIRTVKTYSRSPAVQSGGFSGGVVSGGGNFTVELNSSMVILPKKPMQPRYFDPRVGYFATGYTDYDLNPQGVKSVVMAQRWRLEPKEEDVEKYKRGEMVETKKPIIFFIDPATPKKWVPYLMQGVNDWQIAFEKAGFKNAIIAKMAPTKEEDSTWSLDDARNSAIVYKPSDIANASGPRIWDPRSGEIIESHINWYHNVMELLRDWYFVQCSPVDARARKMIFDDELMGQLIRFVSSHEVGHTIGLRHNYGSSSSVPVENLRNKAWVEANGHTPSIMDYARFNYVAQPEDNISDKGLYPRIGDYDKWAIEWGYKLFPAYKSADDEKESLNKWVIEKLKDKRLWFGTETNPDDPRSQREQVGDDAMKGSMYGIKNLQRIVPNLMEWTKQPNEDYGGLGHMYNEVTSQFQMYMSHVAKYVAGIMETPKKVEEQGPVYEIVAKAKQKEAVDFLNRNLFTTPAWLLKQDIFDRTGLSGIAVIGGMQDNILSRLFNTRTFSKLIEAEAIPGNNAYPVTEFLTDMRRGIWSELAGRKPIDIYRRNLQKAYVNILTGILNPTAPGSTTVTGGITITIITPGGDKSDVKSVVRAHLASLRSEINVAAVGIADPMSKFHLQDVSQRIDKALNPKD